MRYQSREYYCGPASVQNALRALGHRVSQDHIASRCGTTEEGSDEQDVKRAIFAVGYEVDEFASRDKLEGKRWLRESLSRGRPLILCVDSWGHWVSLIGALGRRYVLVDPYPWQANAAENGTHVIGETTLLRRWLASYRTARSQPRLYGLALCKKTS